MKRRKWAVCGLAVVTAVALCAPTAAFAAAGSGYAAGATTSENKTFSDVAGNKANTTAPVVTGTITPTTITAGVPTAAAFGIDPWKTASAPGDQITAQSSDFKIVNLSKFPIFTRITDATIAKGATRVGTNPAAPTLVTSAPAAAGQCQLAIKNVALAPTGFTTASDWMASGTQSYKVATDDIIAAAATDGTGTELPLTIYGQMNGTGWSAMDTFTVTPTFTIQAVTF